MGRDPQGVKLGLRLLPCIWQQLLCLGGLKLLQRVLQAQPFPAQPCPPPPSSVPGLARPGLRIPPGFAPSVRLLLPTVNAGGTELSKLQLFLQIKEKTILDYKMQRCLYILYLTYC